MKKYLYLLAALLLIMAACRKDNNNNAAALNVKTFWPNSGNAGTIVTLEGQGLTRNVTVSFNGAEAKVVDARDSVLIVLAPEQGATGILAVKSGSRKVELGTYTYQALSLHAVSPSNGPAGTNIFIRGAGFSSLNGPAKVTVNGKEAVITGASDTLLVVAVPEAAGTGKIAVTVDGKQVSGPDFTFQYISAIKPVKGGAGTAVTISGEGFSSIAAGNVVTFNGKAAVVLSAAAGKLVVTAPESVATGPVAVSINGQKTVGNTFTVVPKPVIKTVSPLSAPAGTLVDITGEYFSDLSDEVTVTFNGKAGVVTSSADRQLSVKVPAGAGAGNMQLIVNGQQTDGPLFREQSLGVKQLLPDNGLAGTAVMVKGTGFSANPADNIVTFNGIAVPVIAATDSTLSVVAPVGVSTGLLKVKTGVLDAIGPVFRRAGVTTIAGGPGTGLFLDPSGIVADTKGNLFVMDVNVIKKIAPDGTISIFAGRADGTAGSANGTGTAAAFNYGNSLVIDAQDNIYVSDAGNRSIRKITPSAEVSTYGRVAFFPVSLGIDKNGGLYVGAQYAGVHKMDASGNTSVMAPNVYQTPSGVMCIDDAGTLYFTGDFDNPFVYKIEGGAGTRYAGSQWGSADGPLLTAKFSNPSGITRNPATGDLYAIDNQAVRIIAAGNVTTITGWGGTMQPAYGFTDGTLDQARFADIKSLCIDKAGNLYLLERGNKAVRKVFLK